MEISGQISAEGNHSGAVLRNCLLLARSSSSSHSTFVNKTSAEKYPSALSSTKAPLRLSLHRLRRRSTPSEPWVIVTRPRGAEHFADPISLTVYVPTGLFGFYCLNGRWERHWRIDPDSLRCFSCHSAAFTDRLMWSEAARRSVPVNLSLSRIYTFNRKFWKYTQEGLFFFVFSPPLNRSVESAVKSGAICPVISDAN